MNCLTVFCKGKIFCFNNLFTNIQIENLNDPFGPIELLLKRCNKEQLIIRYKIAPFDDATQFLTLVAKKCGKIKKDGIPDLNKAAQLILNDWTR